MSHENLYNVWAKFKNRSAVEQEILKAAGKDNCFMLDGYGDTCEMREKFLDDLRYCLKPEYVIPNVTKIVELTPFEERSIMRVKIKSCCIRVTECSSYADFRGYKWENGLVTRVLDATLGRKIEDEYEWPIVLWKGRHE